VSAQQAKAAYISTRHFRFTPKILKPTPPFGRHVTRGTDLVVPVGGPKRTLGFGNRTPPPLSRPSTWGRRRRKSITEWGGGMNIEDAASGVFRRSINLQTVSVPRLAICVPLCPSHTTAPRSGIVSGVRSRTLSGERPERIFVLVLHHRRAVRLRTGRFVYN